MLLAAQRVDHRALELLAEGKKLIMGTGTARAAKQRYATGVIQQIGEDFQVGGARHDDRGRRQQAEGGWWRRIEGLLKRHIAGNDDHRNTALAHCLPNGDLQGARHLTGMRHKFAIMAAFLEQALGMGLLKIARADLSGRDMRRDRKNRHARTMAIKKAVDEMQISRAAASGAHGERACQMRFGTGGEGGDLLVADMQPCDPVLFANGVSQSVQAVSDNAIHPLHPDRGEKFGELFGDGGHDLTPL